MLQLAEVGVVAGVDDGNLGLPRGVEDGVALGRPIPQVSRDGMLRLPLAQRARGHQAIAAVVAGADQHQHAARVVPGMHGAQQRRGHAAASLFHHLLVGVSPGVGSLFDLHHFFDRNNFHEMTFT